MSDTRSARTRRREPERAPRSVAPPAVSVAASTRDSDPAAAPGRYVGERYRLDELLGVGGSAQVWLATPVDQPVDRARPSDVDAPPESDRVAVKLLHPHQNHDGSSKTRLLTDARAVRQLHHSNIVQLRDVVTNDQDVALVFDYVAGGSLATELRRNGAIEPRRAAWLAEQIADALDYAHRHGTVHRDVTPGNILLDADGRPRLADFGIARLLEESAATATMTGTVLGTLRYMSPEALSGRDADGRADVYSLGVVLYEMLAGRPPFEARTPVALVEQQAAATPPLPEGVPPELAAIALACIRRSPAERPQSAAEVRDALSAWLSGKPLAVAWGERPGPDGTRRMPAVRSAAPLPVAPMPGAAGHGSGAAGHGSGAPSVAPSHARGIVAGTPIGQSQRGRQPAAKRRGLALAGLLLGAALLAGLGAMAGSSPDRGAAVASNTARPAATKPSSRPTPKTTPKPTAVPVVVRPAPVVPHPAPTKHRKHRG